MYKIVIRIKVKYLMAALLLTTGFYAQAAPIMVSDGGVLGDEVTTIIYDAVSGNVGVDTPASTDLTTLRITSVGSIFTGPGPALNLPGMFDVAAPNEIFKLDPAGFSSLSFGPLAQAGLTKAFLLTDLVVDGSKVGGGDLSPVVDLLFVADPDGRIPLPGTLLLIALGFSAMRLRSRSRA